MVFKPSELTPLTAMELARIYTEAGVPDGVFNVVQGDGPRRRGARRDHPGIAKISLTGSVRHRAGRVMAAAADTLKAVTLELGGKSPLIVFEDADLDNAVSARCSRTSTPRARSARTARACSCTATCTTAFVDASCARAPRS